MVGHCVYHVMAQLLFQQPSQPCRYFLCTPEFPHPLVGFLFHSVHGPLLPNRPGNIGAVFFCRQTPYPAPLEPMSSPNLPQGAHLLSQRRRLFYLLFQPLSIAHANPPTAFYFHLSVPRCCSHSSASVWVPAYLPAAWSMTKHGHTLTYPWG